MEDQVTRKVRIDATPEVVWDALTDASKLAAWFGAAGAIEHRLGGEVRFHWPDGTERRGLVIEIDPPHRLAFRWRAIRTYGAALSGTEASVVTFTLEPRTSGQRDGTQVTVTESTGILASDPPPLALAEHH